MALAGWPMGPLRAYRSYMEAVVIRGSYACGVGRAVSRDLSIPQGCPWSMTVLGLFASGWI
eukprot:459593-Alexandrium_andersonii.AAC.1